MSGVAYTRNPRFYTSPTSKDTEVATISPLTALDTERFEASTILKALSRASRSLAELKGVAGTIPNQGILINALGLQEAKDSSEIEPTPKLSSLSGTSGSPG
jgi:hypothetical protein